MSHLIEICGEKILIWKIFDVDFFLQIPGIHL